jgi:WD40 repeat protein
MRACLIGLAGRAQVWDVVTEACQHTLRHHSGKVQAVAWNPAEAPVLLSGGFDQAVALARPSLACSLISHALGLGPGHP